MYKNNQVQTVGLKNRQFKIFLYSYFSDSQTDTVLYREAPYIEEKKQEKSRQKWS